MDPLQSLNPKVNPDVSLFGYFTHVDKTKFLDTGYSELKDFFYIKLSKIDTENYKLEFVVKNEEYDIADYKVRYNQAMREHYILQHIKFKKLLDNIEDHAIKRDKNYLFDAFRLSNEMRLESYLKALEDEKMRLKLEVASLRLKKKEANKELKIKKANKKVVIDNLLYSNLPYDEIFSLENKLIETTKKLEYLTNRLEYTTSEKDSKIEETIKIKENTEYHYLFRDKCYQSYQAHDLLTSLKKFQNCLLDQYIFYKDKSDLAPGDYDEDNEFFLFVSKDEIEKEIEDNIANHKKIISSKLTTIRKKIDNRMEITKKQDFIDFEYLGSNYSNKYKIIELLKYFILFYFLSFIFNSIFYFFSIRKLKNG